MRTRIAACLAALFSTGHPNLASALPALGQVPANAAPASLSVADVSDEGKALTVRLPNGRAYTLSGPRSRSAAGTGVAARSADHRARLYAFATRDRLLSADVYGDFGHYELFESGGRQYWASARPEGQTRDQLHLPVSLTPINPVAVKASPNADGNYEVHVLILHTPLYAQRLPADRSVAAEAERLIFLSNAIHETNAVAVRYVLAGVVSYTGTDESQDYATNLQSMVGNATVTALRDGSGADLVMLLRAQEGNADLCGLSSYFNGFERGDPPQHIDPERDAFNVAGMAPPGVCGDNVFTHELGHSLAAGHDYATSAGFAYWKPYAHASVCPSADGNLDSFSMMWGQGIGPGIGAGVVHRTPGGRNDLITNPGLMLGGIPCGADGVPGVEASQADNARVMAEAAPYVAAYRGEKLASSARASAESAPLLGGGGLFWLPLLALAAIRKARIRILGEIPC